MQEKPEVIEIRDCVCIAHMHADPALLIKAPCKVTAPHVRCLVYLWLFSSLLRALLR